VLVSESGIHTRADVERLEQAGIRAMLIGETLMRSSDIGSKLRELLGT
jgi:indole-3-glycerol phosphate synthase